LIYIFCTKPQQGIMAMKGRKVDGSACLQPEEIPEVRAHQSGDNGTSSSKTDRAGSCFPIFDIVVSNRNENASL